MYINKLKTTVEEQAQREYADALSVANAANIDYIAMMTDVELPTNEQEATNDEQ